MMLLVTLGPALAMLALVLAAAAVGWEPLLRRLTVPEESLTTFAFRPQLIAPTLVLAVLIASVVVVAGVAVVTGQLVVALSAPLVLLVVRHMVVGIARWRYRRRLRQQVILAITQLAAMTRGASGLFAAFRAVGQASDAPLRTEWAWIARHLNVRIVGAFGEAGGVSDHAYTLRALARQTPLDLHAQVLDHLATIYESGAESQSGTRLGQLADVLAQQDDLQLQLASKLGKVQGEAYVIVGAMGAIVLYLLLTQWERVVLAFVVSPYGPFALIWCVLWMALPIVVARWLTRSPNLPL